MAEPGQMMRRWLAATAIAAIGATAVWAQIPGGRFSAAVQTVEVYLSVTDGAGAPVTGLQQGDFRVFEDDASQEVSVSFRSRSRSESTGAGAWRGSRFGSRAWRRGRFCVRSDRRTGRWSSRLAATPT